ncbi:MAG: CRISPR-associated helicase Cas3', partial [Christensenellaceae bacterium]|nr:CRISPR-associated helicase Cas3' [Christensenellaceae bacterium]
KSDDSQIFIIEAPMGSGKTESALISAEQLAYKMGRAGIFFGLPTQATSNGIFPRIIAWLNKIEIDENDKFSLQLSHGKAVLNEVFVSLSSGINIDETGNSNKENIAINEWFSGRKTSSLDDFVVGTVDQFLMLSLKQKHLSLRHLGFSKKVVIIDEVHAYDAYMNQYLKESIVWMGAYNVPVIILSATLPQDRRLELIKSYMRGKGIRYSKEKRNSIKEKLSTNAYPLITYNEGSEIKVYNKFEKNKAQSKVINIIKETYEKILDVIEELVSEGGIVGVIVNTVKKAQKLAKELSIIYGEDMVELLHSGFISIERVKKEEELLSIVGKKANRPNKKIIVGTQVIEQSLDIDFDVMVSELAPMDLLIQRMGRLHRHKIDRPDFHKEPNFYVLGCNEDLEFDKGSSIVYSDFLLTRTQYYLPEKIVVPDDISVLVQKVYEFNLNDNSNCIDIYEGNNLKEKYEKFKSNYRIKIKNKEDKAKAYRISDPILKKTMVNDENLIGWLNNDIVNQSEERANAQVRDINETIEVIAVRKKEDGYCTFSNDTDISKMIEKNKIAKELAKNTIILPNVFSLMYNIDNTISELEKYNFKYLKEWQNSIWLKGTLGIIFDENNEFELCGKKIKYSKKYGISVVEEE